MQICKKKVVKACAIPQIYLSATWKWHILTWPLSPTDLGSRTDTLFFDLKSPIEDGNLQVCMYCVHARKGASEAPRTRFRSMKFLGACPQTPLAQSIIDADPLFVIALGPPYPQQSNIKTDN